jgi:hypothetical protein
MAAGQIFTLTPSPPGQKSAVEETIAATTTATGGPYEVIPVWTFDAATAAYMDFYTKFAGLSATGPVTLRFDFMVTSTATTGIRFGAGIRRYDDAESAIGAHTFDYQFVDSTPEGRSYFVSTLSIVFTATEVDSVTDDIPAVVRFYRDATATHDAVTTNAYILQGGLILEET